METPDLSDFEDWIYYYSQGRLELIQVLEADDEDLYDDIFTLSVNIEGTGG